MIDEEIAPELESDEQVCDTCHYTHNARLTFCPTCHPEMMARIYRRVLV